MNIRELHRQAMEQADRAVVAKMHGDTSATVQHITRAFELEAEAASALQSNLSAEPSRSVLFRSAATLARDCGKMDDARRLIYLGLAGNPPKQIEAELLDLLYEIHPTHRTHSSFVSKTTSLNNDQIYLKLSFSGGVMTDGVLPFQVFKGLVDETYGSVRRIYNPILDQLTGFQHSEQALGKLLSIPVYTPEFASLTITIQRPKIDKLALKKETTFDETLVYEAFDDSTRKFVRDVEEIERSARKNTVLTDYAHQSSSALQIISRLAPDSSKAFDTLSIEGLAEPGEPKRVTVNVAEGGRIIEAADAISRSKENKEGAVVELNRRSNTFVLRTSNFERSLVLLATKSWVELWMFFGRVVRSRLKEEY